MKRTLTLAALPLLALGLGACDVQDDYRAVCVDKYTGQWLPDEACHSGYGGSPFILGMPYYMSGSQYHSTFETGHRPRYNTVLRGGSTVMPIPRPGHKVGVAKVGQKKVTVYEPAKQAGTPIKTNQDAKKVSSVTGSDRKFTVSKKSSSSGFKMKSSSNSSYRRK